jgi:hypothetical protein
LMANLDDLLDAFDDPGQFGEHFEDASWDSWRGLTTALARRPLSPRPSKRFIPSAQARVGLWVMTR